MNRILSLILFLILLQTQLNACLNGYYLDSRIMLYRDEYQGQVPQGHRINEIQYESILSELENQWKITKDITYLSDYGVVLIFQGKYKEAKEIYLKIEKTDSGRYATASNLGTVYELLGQNEMALQWIKEALKRDSTSHHNSEWIHVKILEAKIGGIKFINSQFLLNTDFGTDINPKTLLSKDSLSKLRAQLYYQLNERMTFIKSNDKIVASLLFDLANINYLLGNPIDAKTIYKKAKNYGYDYPVLQKRMQLFDQKENVLMGNGSSTKTLWIIISVLFSLSLITIGFIYFKKRK